MGWRCEIYTCGGRPSRSFPSPLQRNWVPSRQFGCTLTSTNTTRKQQINNAYPTSERGKKLTLSGNPAQQMPIDPKPVRLARIQILQCQINREYPLVRNMRRRRPHRRRRDRRTIPIRKARVAPELRSHVAHWSPRRALFVPEREYRRRRPDRISTCFLSPCPNTCSGRVRRGFAGGWGGAAAARGRRTAHG